MDIRRFSAESWGAGATNLSKGEQSNFESAIDLL